MRATFANLIHYLAIVIAIMLMFSPIIPFLNSTYEANSILELLSIWLTEKDFLKIGNTVFILMLAADFLSLLIFCSPKWFSGGRKRSNFRKFIQKSIKLGMTVNECKRVFDDNTSFALENEIQYRDNYNPSKSRLSIINFYVELYNASIGGALKARKFVRFFQAIILLIMALFFGLNAEHNEQSEILGWTTVGCSIIYYVVTAIILELVKTGDVICVTKKKSFEYCSACKKLVRWEDLKLLNSKRSGPDFSKGKTTVTNSYEEKRLGWIEFSDESVVGVYEKVPQKNVEITAYSHIHRTLACPHCGAIYNHTMQDEKHTKEYTIK